MEIYDRYPIACLTIHAMSAYGAARYYKLTGKSDLYEKYLVEAAVIDGLCQLKETLRHE